MYKNRYDVSYVGRNGDLSVDYHFCRDWDENGGCYGANPDHGDSFDEVKEVVIDYYKSKIDFWEKLTEEQFEESHHFMGP